MDTIRAKTIAITGAARGIGYATAEALLARGARVVIGDRDVALQESAVAGLTKLGQVSGYPLDVSDKESFATFLDKARTDGQGRIDVLINNAGVMPIGPFLEQSEQAIRSAVEVNFYGVLTGCQLVLPEMVARGSGHIVNIASMAGMLAVPGQAVYAGTKFAVVGLSTALSDEFAPQGVEVTRGAADLHQHRTDRRHQGDRRAEAGAARGHRRRGRQGAARSRKPLCPCRLRCGLSVGSRRCCHRGGAAGSARNWAPTGCFWNSTPRRGSPTKTARRRRRASSRPTAKANGARAFRRKSVGPLGAGSLG